MKWPEIIALVKPHVLKIGTLHGSGTGFLIHIEESFIHVATAAHVIRDACTWEQKIILHNPGFEKPIHVTPKHQAGYLLHEELDSAVFKLNLKKSSINGKFPKEAITTTPTTEYFDTGVEVGWLGFPSIIRSEEPCFFSGRISQFKDRQYSIDGTGIPGVSGGPVFCEGDDGLEILGSITAYQSASIGQQSVPGLLFVDECGHWRELLK